MQLRAADRGFNFPYLYDGDTQQASRAYGPMATPHLFIFDEARTLRYAGRIDDAEKPERVTSHDARNALEALLAGEPVEVATTKTFGCSIKWSDLRGSVEEARKRWEQEAVTLEQIDRDGIAALMRNETDRLRLVNVWATWCGPCIAVDEAWAGALPYTALIAPGGNALFRHQGVVDPLELKRAIVGYLGRYYD